MADRMGALAWSVPAFGVVTHLATRPHGASERSDRDRRRKASQRGRRGGAPID